MKKLFVILLAFGILASATQVCADIDVDLDSDSRMDAAFGGTDQDTSGWTGIPYITSGVWDQTTITATPTEINTPLDGALVTLTEFQELETIGATTISANQWAALGGIAETLAAAELNILDGVTGVTAAELSYIGDVTSLIQAQIDLKAPLASPTFTTSITIGSAGISEAELEIIDGALLSTTQLNYLQSATGTTGTTSTSLVFSTSPQLTTPDLGAATADSLTLDAAANPRWVWRDSDGADTDKTAGDLGAGFSDTTSGAEISDFHLGALGGATAGTAYTHVFWDSSDNHLYMGTLAHYTGANPSVAPLDVANYESLVWDFDYGTDTIGVSSPVSGTTTIDWGSLIFITTGAIHGGIEIIADDNSLAAAQCYGSIDKLNGAETTTLPAAVAGMSVMPYSDDATVKTIDPNGTDHIWLNGADNGAGNSINSPGAVGDFIVLVAFSNNNWYSVGQSGTWIDTP